MRKIVILGGNSLNVLKFSMQKLLGEKRYLYYYTSYLARHYR